MEEIIIDSAEKKDTDANLVSAQKLSEQINNESESHKRLEIFYKIVSLLHLTSYSELQTRGLDILSDQPLSPQDIEFIGNIKNKYDIYLNEGNNKPIKLFILNSEHWPIIARCFDVNDHFAGQSVELPVTPFNMQAIMLPSIDAITLKTERKDMFLSLAGTDPEVATIFSRMDDDDKEEVYKLFYLRSMVAHEMSHLYQFSPQEIKDIGFFSENPERQNAEMEKFLPLREWLACALGLYVLKDEPPNRMKILIKINAIAAGKLHEVASLTSNQKYPLSQANRTIQANNFFKLCEAKNTDVILVLKKMNQICASDNDDQKLKLQEILEGKMDEEKFNGLLEFLSVK